MHAVRLFADVVDLDQVLAALVHRVGSHLHLQHSVSAHQVQGSHFLGCLARVNQQFLLQGLHSPDMLDAFVGDLY